MGEGGFAPEEEKPKSSYEEQREIRERSFRGEIQDAYDSITASLKRLGIADYKNGVWSLTGKNSPVDLKDVPSLFARPGGLNKPDQVDFELGREPGNGWLDITWKGPDIEEHVMLVPRTVGRASQQLRWSLNAKDYKGKQINESKSFDGTLGRNPGQITEEDFLSGRFNPKSLKEGLQAKAAEVPRPNPISRLFRR